MRGISAGVHNVEQAGTIVRIDDRPQSTKRRWLVALVVAAPLLFSLRSIGDPFGQTEEAVNATIWALGGRNILERGPVAAKFGALVAPYPGTGGGTYAHHPPLPVWISAILQLLGSWEGWPRLAGLLCLVVALYMLLCTLRLLVSNEAALLGVAMAAGSGFALTYGRLFTTLTLATPLFMAMAYLLVRRIVRREPPGWPLPVLLFLCIFSSWDGVIGAAAIVVALGIAELRDRAIAGAIKRAIVAASVGVAALALLLAYLVWANGGPTEILGQARYRSSGSEFTIRAWLSMHAHYYWEGLGPVGILVLFGTPIAAVALRLRPTLLALLLLVAMPGVGMTIGLRQGAYGHAFWSYNLILPLGFAAGILADWALKSERSGWKAVLFAALVIHVLVCARAAGEQLAREHDLNTVGELTKRLQPVSASEPVRMFSAYAFHPYATWYLRGGMDVALSVADLRHKLEAHEWEQQSRVLVDSEFARNAGCPVVPYDDISASRRWLIVRAGVLSAHCPR
jgi:hypothetical protein